MNLKHKKHLASLYLILQFVFIALSFAGAAYVLANNGEPSAGYAVVPMVWSLVFGSLYRNSRKNANK